MIGCAPVPGNSLSVVRFTPSLEGILWAHEYGHNKWLNHRNDDPNAVMNGTIGSTRLRVNAPECTSYQNSPGDRRRDGPGRTAPARGKRRARFYGRAGLRAAGRRSVIWFRRRSRSTRR